jgi:GNAT superfamily N-acetyltransferase
MEHVKLYNNAMVEITVGDVCNVDDIAQFQVDMAMESEGLALDSEHVRKGVEAVLEDETKGRYVIARIGGEVVGCLMITREWSDWNCCWYWWIQSVYVLPSYRGKGIFSAMYSRVKEMAREEGVSQIRLYVDKENIKARNVYQRLGMNECHYLMYDDIV